MSEYKYRPRRELTEEDIVMIKALRFHGIKYDVEAVRPERLCQWYDPCCDSYYVNVTFKGGRRAIDELSNRDRNKFHDLHPGQIYPPMENIEFRSAFDCEKCGGNLVVRNKDASTKCGTFCVCAYCGGMVKEVTWRDNVRKDREEGTEQ